MTTPCFELALCAGQGQAEGSYEYLVFNSTLLGVAAEHGLHPITDWEDPELDECFDQACALATNSCMYKLAGRLRRMSDCEGGGEECTLYAHKRSAQPLLL